LVCLYLLSQLCDLFRRFGIQAGALRTKIVPFALGFECGNLGVQTFTLRSEFAVLGFGAVEVPAKSFQLLDVAIARLELFR
jgi:hypothetical protein